VKRRRREEKKSGEQQANMATAAFRLLWSCFCVCEASDKYGIDDIISRETNENGNRFL
jgi:hypothetical protein